MQAQITKQDTELTAFGREVDKLIKEVDSKLTAGDGKRIWRHFQRFSEYEDLKQLYMKCIPEIARFEQRLLDF